jgi:hypothetical protein
VIVENRGSAILSSCDFSGNTARYGGAVWDFDGDSTLTACTFAGGAGSHTDSVENWNSGSITLNWNCPKGSTGAPYVMTGVEQLEANQLPPAKEVCTPCSLNFDVTETDFTSASCSGTPVYTNTYKSGSCGAGGVKGTSEQFCCNPDGSVVSYTYYSDKLCSHVSLGWNQTSGKCKKTSDTSSQLFTCGKARP